METLKILWRSMAAEASSILKKWLRSGTEELKGKMLLRIVHRHQNGSICSEFGVLDLDTGDLRKTPFTLFGIGGICSMLAVESTIYLIGTPFRNGGDNIGDDCGMLSLDLSKPDIGWKKAPFMNESYDYFKPECVSCCGKIYVFKFSGSSCIGEVFDPQLNRWNPLLDPPPVHGGFEVTYPVISDPLRGRVLFHFFKKGCKDECPSTSHSHSPPLSCIYAYYPNRGGIDGGRWECLDDNFNGRIWNWETPTVVVDDIIYIYYHKFDEMIEAYDLRTKQYLKVVISYDLEMAYACWKAKFVDLQDLGNGVLCLTSFRSKFKKFASSITNDHTLVYAFKFKVEPKRSHNQVLLTTVSSISSQLQIICDIRNNLAI
ncbi:unnamed protein product [Amaranthus hypochondriacus]